MADEHLQDPDVQRMLRVRDGDESAFAELVRTYGPMLAGFMQRFVGPQGPIEDLSQEVFLKVHRAAPTYEPRARFRTWLFTIATNVCLNEKRRASRHFLLSLDRPGGEDGERSLSDQVEDGREKPEADMERSELKERVRGAIDDLPDNQRVAVLLARYEGLSYVEIAEALSMTVMAVKSLLNRAKNNLKENLQRDLKDFLVTRTEDA